MNWLVLAIIAAILFGVSPLFMKSGVKKTNPYVGATVWATTMFVAAGIKAIRTHSVGSLSSFGGLRLLFLVLAGIALGGFIVFLFKALKAGEAMRVMPVVLVEYFLFYIVQQIIGRHFPGIIRIVILVVVAVAIGLMLSKGKGKAGTWIAYSFIAIACLMLSKYLYQNHVGNMNLEFRWLCLLGIVAVMTWIVTLATGSVKSIRNMSFLEGIYLIVSVLLLWIANECAMMSISYTALVQYEMILLASLVGLLVFACVFLKERITTSYVIGLVLLELSGVIWLGYIPNIL